MAATRRADGAGGGAATPRAPGVSVVGCMRAWTTILPNPPVTAEIVSPHDRSLALALLPWMAGEDAMKDDDTRKEPADPPDRSDQLSPGHALGQSVWSRGSQRIGNNTPIANPETAFPHDPADDGRR